MNNSDQHKSFSSFLAANHDNGAIQNLYAQSLQIEQHAKQRINLILAIFAFVTTSLTYLLKVDFGGSLCFNSYWVLINLVSKIVIAFGLGAGVLIFLSCLYLILLRMTSIYSLTNIVKRQTKFSTQRRIVRQSDEVWFDNLSSFLEGGAIVLSETDRLFRIAIIVILTTLVFAGLIYVFGQELLEVYGIYPMSEGCRL